MVWVPSQSLLANPERFAYYKSGSSVNKQLVLTNGTTFTDASTISAILAAEISGNGYSRPTLTISTFAWDGGQTRQELVFADVTFTASGGAIQFDTRVIVSDSAANFDWIDLPTASTTIADGSSRTIRALINFGKGAADVNAA